MLTMITKSTVNENSDKMEDCNDAAESHGLDFTYKQRGGDLGIYTICIMNERTSQQLFRAVDEASRQSAIQRTRSSPYDRISQILGDR